MSQECLKTTRKQCGLVHTQMTEHKNVVLAGIRKQVVKYVQVDKLQVEESSEVNLPPWMKKLWLQRLD